MRNILLAIKNLFNRKASHSGAPAYVYVYSSGKDASNSEVNPNDQIAILRRLSSFASKKNSPVTIIFPGRPSKKIPDGAKQDGVQARFATNEQLNKVVKQCVEEFRKTNSVVLAAERSEFQKMADKLGADYRFASTFAKTLDTVCGPIQRETKPQPPRKPQPAKNVPAPSESSEATPPVAASAETETVLGEPIIETLAPESQPFELESVEATHEPIEPISEDESHPQPPKIAPSTRPKLHRHVPSQKREYTDKAILDLIDPL